MMYSCCFSLSVIAPVHLQRERERERKVNKTIILMTLNYISLSIYSIPLTLTDSRSQIYTVNGLNWLYITAVVALSLRG